MDGQPPPDWDHNYQPDDGLYNVEAEQAVLGAALLNNGVVDKVAGFLRPEHFYDPVHRRIWETVQGYLARGTYATPVTIKHALSGDEGLDQLGGPAYLVRLAEATVSILAARDYAVQIRDLWARRSAVRSLREGVQDIVHVDPTQPGPAETVAKVEGRLTALFADIHTNDLITSFGRAVEQAMLRTEAGYKSDGAILRPTGIGPLDDILGGLNPGRSYILGGRTAMGKTVVATEIALNVAQQKDPQTGRQRGVCFVSFEMPAHEIAHRAISGLLARDGRRVPYFDLQKGNLEDTDLRAALDAAQRLESLPIYTVEDDCNDLGKVRAAVRRAKKTLEGRGAGLDLVVLDYLQIAHVSGARGRSEMVATMAIAMKSLAKELDIPVLSLSQVRREVEDREDKRPYPADMRWAGELEEQADAVIMVYRHAHYLAKKIEGESDAGKKSELIAMREKTRNHIELIVRKNRGGPEGIAQVWGDVKVNRIADQSPDGLPADQEDFG